ncbi:TonB-dependent receptor [Maribellus maritimus]|uniref:TonB-dependent receptor n=1 Tax=Maribellus maritimus TaxID=2870838 RepID=UPI001EEC1C96|nr:TonB-dependent receptor [Maribellus maritimus]MCG6186923.1 TonB-dependent receptor [Maribellus maritimus]
MKNSSKTENRLVFFLMLFLTSITSVFADDNITISGYVKSAETGEGLIGSTIYVEELKTGTATNAYGFYSLTLPKGNYTVRYSYIGYENVSVPSERITDNTKDIELQPASTEMDEIVIRSEAEDKNIRKAQMGVTKLSPKETKMIPVILGEQDILKTIQLLPGVSSGIEGTSGFYVRGGGVDQNLIILDEAPVYSASHLMGFFSVFNSDAIKDLELYKGNAPANYGGRLSSILNIQMNDGNSKKFTTSGGLGLLSSRLTLESPIVKDKGSFIISGRRSYADMFMVFSKDRTQQKTDLYFYDLNAKANYKINDNNRIYLSGYLGRDVFNIDELFALKWGNKTGTFRWNHVFNNKLFLNSSLIYSDYDYGFGYNFSDNMIYIKSGIRDINWKEDFQYYINSNNTLKFGVNAIYHYYQPGKINADKDDLFNSLLMNEKHAFEGAFYVSHNWNISDKIKVTYGLRYSGFMAVGPDTVYTYNEKDERVNTEVFSEGEVVKKYKNIEPRATFNIILNKRNSIKFSYARNAQYVHLLSNSSASLPTDLWIPSSKNVKPQVADQLALGFYKNFNNNMFETSIEVYHKDLMNQIDYQNGAEILLNDDVESQLVFGKGRAYGLELYIKKQTGKLTGWIGYTLSRTEKSMDEIDNGNWFPAKQDRTHDISVVGMYQLNEKWNLSANWVYNTGNAVTFPSGKYTLDGFTVPVYTKRNGYRMPDYHRLDLGATYTPKKKKRFESSWNFSIYNAYGRRNAFSITFQGNENNPTQTEAMRLALFQMIPSVTYNFKF